MRISDWSSDVCSSDLRNRALRWRLPSLFRTTPSPTSAAHGRKSARRVLLLRYSLRLNIVVSDREVAGNAQMPAHDIDELRIALRGPYGRKMTGRPDCKSDQPKKIGRAHSELQSLMRLSYAVFCLKKNNKTQ